MLIPHPFTDARIPLPPVENHGRAAVAGARVEDLRVHRDPHEDDVGVCEPALRGDDPRREAG